MYAGFDDTVNRQPYKAGHVEMGNETSRKAHHVEESLVEDEGGRPC